MQVCQLGHFFAFFSSLGSNLPTNLTIHEKSSKVDEVYVDTSNHVKASSW
jgi:hypothetical protein